MNLTQEEAHRLFEYKDGDLFWKIRPAMCMRIGSKVGGTNGAKQPYLRSRYKDQRFMVHQIVFLMHKGYLPKIIDHIDGNIQNNSIENLRDATKSENAINKKIRKDSCTGVKNVSYHKPTGKYKVCVTVNKKRTHIGSYDDLEFAELVSLEAQNKFYGTFASYQLKGA
jgi:hypothetical protein